MVMNAIMMVLEVFNHKTSGRIVGVVAQKGYGRGWGWASLDAALYTTGLWTIR